VEEVIVDRSSKHVGAPSRGATLRVVFLGGWVLASVLAGGAACSVVVESETNQCALDADCGKFKNGSVCQGGLCVLVGAPQTDCFEGKPVKNEEFLNQCTNAQCIEFDNCERLGLCNGTVLPALVDPPPPQ
jgi:hypothetical protein